MARVNKQTDPGALPVRQVSAFQALSSDPGALPAAGQSSGKKVESVRELDCMAGQEKGQELAWSHDGNPVKRFSLMLPAPSPVLQQPCEKGHVVEHTG